MLAWLVVADGPAPRAARRHRPRASSASAPRASSRAFHPDLHDYVVRCNDGQVRVSGHAFGAWRAAIGNHAFAAATSAARCRCSAGRAFSVISKRPAKQVGQAPAIATTCAACPSDFPTYTFTRDGPVSPQYFSVDPDSTPRQALRDHLQQPRGAGLVVPTRPPRTSRVLPDGTILWFDRSSSDSSSTAWTGAWSAPWMPSATRPTPTTCSYSTAATTCSAPTSSRATSTRAPTAAPATPPSSTPSCSR